MSKLIFGARYGIQCIISAKSTQEIQQDQQCQPRCRPAIELEDLFWNTIYSNTGTDTLKSLKTATLTPIIYSYITDIHR